MKLTDKFFIISDTHFGHKRIIDYENRPENHEEVMIKNWNSVVNSQDSVLHLGDLHLTNFPKAYDFCNRLNGKKYLIRGNHDGNSEKHYNLLGFEVIEPIFKFFNEIILVFTHQPLIMDENHMKNANIWNIHGHIHSKSHPDIHVHSRHINMSVEVINYTPVRLADIITNIKEGKYATN